MLKLHVLASGSRGNAAIVECASTGEGVLIDCGICKRDFLTRAAEAGFDPAKLRAVLVTHDHGDHTKGLGVVLRGLAKEGARPTVCASDAVVAASSALRDALASVGVAHTSFASGDALELAGMIVRPFRTSHDAAASFGFRFDELREGDSLGFMTDTGTVTAEARAALAGVRLLALEANHDAHMLEVGPYPYVIKQRIASDWGHLSNAQAAAFLAELAHDSLRHVVAMHVSQENNTYRLPRAVFEEALSGAGFAVASADPGHPLQGVSADADAEGEAARGVSVSVAFQDRLVSIA